ncbi:MAG TPA: aspartate aminotransferase family protein [Planctomycetota bacterium]|nr:aspartate aminotransferase family protein [Planctomycetota bacterium]
MEQILESTAPRTFSLHEQHGNVDLVRVLRVLGFDKVWTRGFGPYLFDAQGHRYLDLVGGFGVFALGRNHPEVRRVLKQALDLDLPNLTKLGVSRLGGALAEKLVSLAPGDLSRVYFSNSGTEGVETAIKYARAATGRDRILYCKKGYHGLTMGALSANGGGEFREGFGKLLADFTEIPFNDLGALEAELTKRDVAGFVVEPIQGKGVFVPSDDYLPGAAELCRRHGAVFIADEVQTGLGRTGRLFACEHWGVEPDILVLSKALSAGQVPVGAVLCRDWIHRKVFGRMDRCMVHSTTFTQNDLAMAAGLAFLHVVEEERLVENAATVGGYLIDRLRELATRHDFIHDVRGRGCLVAIEFGPPKRTTLRLGWNLLRRLEPTLFSQGVLIPLFRDHRILAQVAGHHLNVIKFLPPLVITKEDVDWLIGALDEVLASCARFPGPVWDIARQLHSFLRKRSE